MKVFYGRFLSPHEITPVAVFFHLRMLDFFHVLCNAD